MLQMKSTPVSSSHFEITFTTITTVKLKVVSAHGGVDSICLSYFCTNIGVADLTYVPQRDVLASRAELDA